MGARSYLWHLTLSAFLCTIMVLEGRGTTATTESHIDVSRSTNSTNRTVPAASSSNVPVAELSNQTTHSLLGTTPLSPSTVGGEGRMNTTTTTIRWEGNSLGTSLGSGAVSPALPTTGTGTTTATESGTPSSLSFSSAVMSRSSSSPMVSSAVTPSPQQSSTSSTTGTPLATTSHPPTALVFSSPSSTAGTTGIESEPIGNSPAPTTHSTSPGPSTSATSSKGPPAVTPSPQQSSTSSTTGTPLATTSHPPTALVFSTAGVTLESDTVTAEMTPSPAPSTASTNPVPSASITSPASGATAPNFSSPAGSSTGTSTPQLPSTPLTPGQPTLEVPATGSPSPSTATASVGSSATAPPGEGDSSTMSQGSRTTAEPTSKTSNSLPSTSSATPSTTNLSTSTSVNPSFTCSPITLSIQLWNVTSTMIQFRWKTQGGTADSPYTVRLLGKSGKMEEMKTNETSTAFENLLAGHQYQISVDVSTCSKNVSTSLTVQTAAKVYNGTTRIFSEDFKPEYQDKSSTEFKEFENKFIMEITKHLPQKIQELANRTKIRIVINSIEKGSVIVHFDVVVDAAQNITKTEVSDAFIEALNKSTVFKVDLQNTSVEARNSCKPGLNDCNQNSACITEGATYSCQCNKGFNDTSPDVPGRVCQQDLPSQRTTPAPPDNITSTTGTGSTTPAPPDNNTTSTTGTASTTPAPPDNNTTSTTGTGSTTPAPPDNITSTTGTGSTDPVPPDNNTTSTTGTGSTTPAPPDNITSTTGTASTTPAPPDNITSTTGTGSTTPVPPDNITSTTGTGSTTPVPPDNITSTTGTGSTTPAPPDNITSTTGTGSTTPAPPDNITSTTGRGSTTPAPPDTNTTSTTGRGSTTPAPPDTNTTSTTGTGSTAPTRPDINTTNTTGTAPTTPVPPDTNTTGFTGSTSNSFFTTTFTSEPCMAVSIEVQDVTAEEIRLSWTSSSNSSIYNISVTDGRETKEITTEDTKAVFGNLLPGQLYNISVAVSSCAENIHASVAVRTDPASCFKRTEFCSAQNTGCSDLKGIVCSNNQAFAFRIWFKGQKFNNALYNSESKAYRTMSDRIKTDVVEGMQAKLGNDHLDVVVLAFRPGSVVADVLFLLPKEEAVDVGDIQTLLREVVMSKFGNQTEALFPSVLPPTDNVSPWRVAVIVLGVLLGVALVVILLAILFYIYERRRSGMEFSTLYTW